MALAAPIPSAIQEEHDDRWNPPEYYDALEAENIALVVAARAASSDVEGAEAEADKAYEAAMDHTRSLLRAWNASCRHFTITEKTFTKREEYPDETGFDLDGNPSPVSINLLPERGRIERDTLELIAAKTDLPVPKVISFIDVPGEPFSLTVQRMPGRVLTSIRGDDYLKAVEKTKKYIETKVLPTLRGLRSDQLGLGGIVVPPSRIFERDCMLTPRGRWNSVTILGANFVFCHNDLAQHNIMIDEKTLEVTAIIDWEFAGFYPAEFEYPFWEMDVLKGRKIEGYYDEEEPDRLIKILQSLGAGEIDKRPRPHDYYELDRWKARAKRRAKRREALKDIKPTDPVPILSQSAPRVSELLGNVHKTTTDDEPAEIGKADHDSEAYVPKEDGVKMNGDFIETSVAHDDSTTPLLPPATGFTPQKQTSLDSSDHDSQWHWSTLLTCFGFLSCTTSRQKKSKSSARMLASD